MDRREFLRLAGGAAGAAALGPACGRRSSGSAGTSGARVKPKLRIVQFSHFVQAYDRWFDGFAARWGAEHDTDVVVDRIFTDDIPLRADAEVTAGRGHDLFGFAGTPVAIHEDDVIDHRDIVTEIEGRVGPMLPVLDRVVRNPKTGKYVGVCDFWAPIPVNYRVDLFDAIEPGLVPDSWETIARVGPALKAAGTPVGVGLSPLADSQFNAFALLFAFGASLQDEDGIPVLAGPAAVEAVKFAASLYRSGMTEDVLTWDNVADNRALAAGKSSLILDPVAALRATEKQDAELASRVALAPVPAGPGGRLGPLGVTQTYVIWKFAANPSGAARFLADLAVVYREAFQRSEFYNLPAFPGAVSDLPDLLAADPVARPAGKYSLLATAQEWSTNSGHPGADHAAVAEVLNEFVVVRMFAAAARGEKTAEAAVADADAEMRPIFDKWRERGKI